MVFKTAIFVNPNSGRLSWEKKLGRAEKAAERLKQIFWYEGEVEVEVFREPTRSRGEFQNLLEEESRGRDCAIIGSGDGGFSDGLNHIDRNCILGYLPLGSGNNTQTAFLLHRLSLGNRIIESDLIFDEVNEKKCLFIGAGLDGYMMNESDKYREKGWRGFLRYIPSAWNTFGDCKAADIEINVDGAGLEEKSAYMVYIGKHPIAAICLPLLPGAKFDDGYLHGAVFNKWYIPNLKFSGKNIDAKFSSPWYVERDGEVVGLRYGLNVRIEEKARKLLTARL